MGAIHMAMIARSTDVHPNPEGKPLSDEPGMQEAQEAIDWEYWHEVNADIVAWLEIPGTAVNTPVVKAPTDDPGFYLSHDVYGGWNYCGCPYVDAGCANGVESWSVVISGHNITFPSGVFHDIERYHDPAFAKEHETLNLHTPGEMRQLEVVGVKTIPGSKEDKRTSFACASDYWGYYNETLDSLDFRLSEERRFERLYAICSCSYYFNPANERTLVYAVERHASCPE